MKTLSIILLCLFSFSVYGQLNLKDSILVILNNDTVDARIRFNSANMMIYRYASADEAETIAMETLYPFAMREWDNPTEQQLRLRSIYLILSVNQRERGGDDRDEKERLFAEKALEAALNSGDRTAIATSWHVMGNMEFKRGDVKRAHEYFYKVIEFYDEIGQYVSSSEVLYFIFSTFFDIKDTEGIERVLRQMREYVRRDDAKQLQYQYNVVKHQYFGLLIEQKDAIDWRLVDSIFMYIRKNIYLVENHLEELAPNWIHGYSYFYLAKAFDTYFPEQTDSIFYYLDKALAMYETELYPRAVEANSVLEFNIFVNNVRASALFREGRIREAYHASSEALKMLNVLIDYDYIDEQRHKTYQFLADYYEMTSNFAEALRFQKLLRENEARRYETEKMRAINDMLIKHETEKKEIQIQTLVKEQKSTRRILWLTVGLSLALLTTAGFIIFSNRLKRRNVEQQLYETALLAELRHNELEKIQNIQQKIEQHPVKITIENIAQSVSASLIEKDDKRTYLDRLSKIDFQLLEAAYQSSKVKITGMDMKYIICFAANIDVKDVSLLFNIEPASVHTVRYRIRKKFAKEDSFRMIL